MAGSSREPHIVSPPTVRRRRHQRSARHWRRSAKGSGRVRTTYTASRWATWRFSSGPGRQLLQYLLENVAGMPHIVEGTAAARAVRVLGIQGPSPGRPQERPITPQRAGRGPREDVVAAREALHSMDRQTGNGGEPVDPTRRRVLPDARTIMLGAQGARPSTRHRPFGMRSCPSSCRTHACAARNLRDSPQTWTDARLCRVRGRRRGEGSRPLPDVIVGRQVAVAAAAARPAWRPEKRQPPRKVPSRER